MFKKKYLITSSVVIALILFNANEVNAENNQDFQTENSNTEVQEISTDMQQFELLNINKEETIHKESSLQTSVTSSTEPPQTSDTSRERINQLIETVKKLLNDGQLNSLDNILLDKEIDFTLFKNAISMHENGEFDQGSKLYERFLIENEVNQQNADLVNFFNLLSQRNTYIKDFDYLEADSELIKEALKITEHTIGEPEEVAEEPSTEETEEITEEPATEGTDEDAEPKTPQGDGLESSSDIALVEPTAEIQAAMFSVITGSEEIYNEQTINYRGVLTRTWDGINTKPWGTAGYQTIRQVGDLVGREISVTKEATTDRATWAYVQVLGTGIKGWVDTAGIKAEEVLSEQTADYRAVLSRTWDGINTQPYGTRGYETIRSVGDLVGSEVRVTREAVTQRATWAYVEIVDTNISGWIDKSGLKPSEILDEKAINYRGVLTRTWDGINTKPWGTAGYQTIRQVEDLVGREISVTKEATTDRATWAYVQVLGTGIKGWVDTAGIKAEEILSERNVNYYGELTRTWDGINTHPYGTRGYETIRSVGDLVGSEVRVTREAVTQRATWAYVEIVDTNISGWIDKAGLQPKEIFNEVDTNYRGALTRTWDGINTKPYGTIGYQTIRQVGNLVGKEVVVTKEATTDRATWAYLQVVGTGIRGWVDTAGIKAEEVLSERNVNYKAYLTRTWDGINTQPYGTRGYETIRSVGDLVGSEVRVTREAVTQRATWAYIHVVGTDIFGWVDKEGTSLGSVAIRHTFYNRTFEEALSKQMNHGTPKTDLYGDLDDDGNNWEDAKKADVAYYLNPENFANVKNGTTTQYVDKLQISASGLNVRVTPPSGSIIGVALRNEVYDVIDESNGWYKIDFHGQEGWVSGSFVSPIGKIKYQNEVDNSKMLQFLSLSNPSGITAYDLNRELRGKGILEGRGQAFIEASHRYNINEIYLVSHALLETGNGASKLATGVEVNGVTVYNMFGIGAYDDIALEAGSQRAYEEGWTTPERAIIGGAQFIASSYINSPTYKQDTLYKMRWNPANPTVHQYATDIGWAIKQTRYLDKIIELSDKYDLVLKFDVPVYK